MMLGTVPKTKKYIEDVFTQTAWEGNGTNHTVTNGFDYTTDGSMIILKCMNANHTACIATTEEKNGDGSSKILQPENGNGWRNESGSITLTSTGITFGDGGSLWNDSGKTYTAQTFKRSPGFFDMVEFSGNSTSRSISHNLGTVPGMIWLKRTSGAGDVGDFWVYHKDVTTTSGDYLSLRNTNYKTNSGESLWDISGMTATTFGLGTDAKTNGTGNDYIAFLFSDGSDESWGEGADEAIIKCSTYTGNGSTSKDSPKDAGVGWEVSYLVNKAYSSSSGYVGWSVLDSISGYGGWDSNQNRYYEFNSTGASQQNNSFGYNSFIGPQMWETNVNVSGTGYLYLAVRRMGQKPVKLLTHVFATVKSFASVTTVPPGSFRTPAVMYENNRAPDFVFAKRYNSTPDWFTSSRMNNGQRWPMNKDDQRTNDNDFIFTSHRSVWTDRDSTTHISRIFTRAHGWFDHVEFKGEPNTITVDHGLGVVPDMIWIRGAANMMVASTSIDSGGTSWTSCLNCGVRDGSGNMNKSNYDAQGYGWNASTDPTATTITLAGSSNANTYKWSNGINSTIRNQMFLFKMIPGQSKIGRYDGSGSSVKSIDCGFSNGIRFVIVKRCNGGGGGESDWWTTDSELGITSNDSFMGRMNRENTFSTENRIRGGYSAGFRVGGDLNYSGSSWWYFAIAA